MLRVAGTAAIAATENLAAAQQALDHMLPGHDENVRQHFGGLDLGFDAVDKRLTHAFHAHDRAPAGSARARFGSCVVMVIL